MSLFPRITSGDPMEVSGGEPTDPLESSTEASLITSNQGPIHSTKYEEQRPPHTHWDIYEGLVRE